MRLYPRFAAKAIHTCVYLLQQSADPLKRRRLLSHVFPILCRLISFSQFSFSTSDSTAKTTKFNHTYFQSIYNVYSVHREFYSLIKKQTKKKNNKNTRVILVQVQMWLALSLWKSDQDGRTADDAETDPEKMGISCRQGWCFINGEQRSRLSEAPDSDFLLTLQTFLTQLMIH